jgi:hypothetical protein
MRDAHICGLVFLQEAGRGVPTIGINELREDRARGDLSTLGPAQI